MGGSCAEQRDKGSNIPFALKRHMIKDTLRLEVIALELKNK